MTVETGHEADAPTEVILPTPRTGWAAVPKVNLLPPEILEVRRFRRVRQGLGVAVLAVVAGAAIGTYWAQTEVDAAEQDLVTAQSTVSQLQREQQRYAEAPRVIAQVEAAQSARATAMASDVPWYQFLSRLAAAEPAGVNIASFTVSVTGAAPTAATGPLAEPGIGSIAMQGDASSYTKVASWLESVVRVRGLKGSTLSTATKQAAGEDQAADVTFSSGVVVTPEALSRRYERKAG